MKYTNLTYQSKVLNRLADRAYKAGGLDTMKQSLDKAMARIWAALDTYYAGRTTATIQAGHNLRQTV